MKELAQTALEAARQKGASYADVRVIRAKTEHVSTRNGAINTVRQVESAGIGVRALYDGAWGFASSATMTAESAREVAESAVEIAKASALLRIVPVDLAPAEALTDTWSSPLKEDPFSIPLEEKIATLLRIDRILRKRSEVKVARGQLRFAQEDKFFASTEGSALSQRRTTSGVGYSATAVAPGVVQTRSFPNAFGGQFALAGYELLRRWPLVDEAERVADEAVALLKAPRCPDVVTDLILGSSQLALQVHESAGHPAELDRVLGSEANYAGKSFLSMEKLGSFAYGSEAVNITAGATDPEGLGSYAWDDEGVPSTPWHLVRKGTFVGYLTSRETAPVVGLGRSQGAMRADGWSRIPLIRMNNVSLQPGAGSLEELIAGTDDGVLMDTNRTWSIDNLRYNFQFGCEIAWEIKKGKRTRMLQNPSYTGITPEFWRSCDHVCGPAEWTLWGVPNCGKGNPGQIMGTGHGAAPARFRKIHIFPGGS